MKFHRSYIHSHAEDHAGQDSNPSRIFLVEVVVEADRLYLFVVIAEVRNALSIRATVSIRWIVRCRSAIRVQRTPEHGERRV
jgi:hypothetical protein